MQDLSVQIGGVCAGEDALLTVWREDDSLNLLVPIEKEWMQIAQDHGVQVTAAKDELSLPAQWIGTETREDGLYARLQLPWMDGQNLIGKSHVTLDSVSTKSAYLIPTKAAAEGSVLILQQRPGYFGYEYSAKLVSVQTGGNKRRLDRNHGRAQCGRYRHHRSGPRPARRRQSHA